MAELYTSLTQLKMAMNGGQMPPMTPLTEEAKKLIDPEFTIGMGALMEDAQLGLRCPIRGCGQWTHGLSNHLYNQHRSVGGAAALKRALSIPPGVALTSSVLKQKLQRKARWQYAHGTSKPDMRALTIAAKKSHDRSGAVARREATLSVNGRNLRDRCEAQLRAKFQEFYQDFGRAPTRDEMKSRHTPGLVTFIERVYGTYNNAIGQFGLPSRKKGERPRPQGVPRENVLAALRAWYDEHGCLPESVDAARRDRTPLIHGVKATTRTFGASSWPEAMRRAAVQLQIYGGKYGIPEHLAPNAEPISRDGYSSAEQAAAILGCSMKLLVSWRAENRGPEFIREGRRIFYSNDVLYRWLEEHHGSLPDRKKVA